MNEAQQINESRVQCSALLDGWRIGQEVWTGVWTLGKWQRMARGKIVAVHSGYCDVDIMSLHGGAPWITQHTALEAV